MREKRVLKFDITRTDCLLHAHETKLTEDNKPESRMNVFKKGWKNAYELVDSMEITMKAP